MAKSDLRWSVRRRLERLHEQHAGETGIFVAGRFGPTLFSTRPYTVGVAAATVDDSAVTVDQRKSGPVWIPLDAGTGHVVSSQVKGMRKRRRIPFHLVEGEHKLLILVPPRRDGSAAVVDLVDLP